MVEMVTSGVCADEEEEEESLTVLTEARHLEPIAAPNTPAHSWRHKERMKTVSVALVLCLNIPVDPPDIVKIQPCARLEAWIDPQVMTTKAIDAIGSSLQKAYERWQPRARYKHSLDPTVEEVKKLCTSLRRNAKEERVLFHYNGHGVPKPTTNGEIWVFNKSFTQYIPLSIYELQTWMGAPSIYVYDCSNAGIIIKLFEQFAEQHEELKFKSNNSGSSSPVPPTFRQCIQLAACGAKEVLPMNPDLPADVFTSCLTTPIKMAVRWYLLQNKGKRNGLNLDIADQIPGQLSDRRTMLGELNWIFTAITDTIAWNTLPRDLFQKLFRQDLLVASLFRNFLLAQRIMRSYDCTPVSSPELPQTHQHPMWDAWDLALELCLSQLPLASLRSEDPNSHVHSPFFEEQLTAFQVWLNLGHEQRHPPEQLPILLQVLLSQVHRPRALELLGSFLALGPWAVNLVLSVGIFPYVLRLLQSSARELRPLLVFLWAKILAVDPSCKGDLVRENGYKYFLQVLADTSMPAEHRTMAAFVLGVIVWEYPDGQRVTLQGSLMPHCLEQVTDSHAPLRQWATICLGRAWHHHPDARWAATRDNAHEKLYSLLTDRVPEVRAAAVFSLGTFISSLVNGERTDHARAIDHTIAIMLANTVSYDGSPLVRQELVVSLQLLILMYESSFVAVARHFFHSENDVSPISLASSTDSIMSPSSNRNTLGRYSSRQVTSPGQALGSSPELSLLDYGHVSPLMRRTASTHSISNLGVSNAFSGVSSLSYNGMYSKLWLTLLTLEHDPFPAVASLARTVVDYVRSKTLSSSREIVEQRAESAPGTPINKPHFITGESPPSTIESSTPTRSRSRLHLSNHTEDGEESFAKPVITTEFVEWSAKVFILPHRNSTEDLSSPSSPLHALAERAMNSRLLAESEERRSVGTNKLDDQVFVHRNPSAPAVLLFHPTEPLLTVADKSNVTIWDVERNSRVSHWSNNNAGSSCISSLAVINPGTQASYVATGCDDGSVRIWKDAYQNSHLPVQEPPSLITAFQATNDINPATRDAGLLLSWEQDNKTMVIGGDSRTIRLWDLQAERRTMELPTGGESKTLVTAIHSHQAGPWIVAGFSDGYVRVLDRRLPNNKAVVRQWREHTSCVISTHLLNASRETTKIITGVVSGEVRLWDMRQRNSVQVCAPNQEMTAMATHANAHLFATGSVNQVIGVHHASGSSVNVIKYHDGFMGTRIGPVSCLAFHPRRVLLAAGTTDSYISVYGLSRR